MIDLNSIPRNGDFIQLHSGKAFYFLDPLPRDIHIEDIAHTLSLLCRFGGHCSKFYSVAEHSVRCSWEAEEGFELEALLHDGGEAYLVDMPRPIKNVLTEYKELEKKIDLCVRQRFRLPDEMTDEVRLIDNRMLATERRDLMTSSEKPWMELPEPYEGIIEPWTSGIAKSEFINRYHELTE